MGDVILVMIGGGIGSALRYIVSLAAGRFTGDDIGWGTLAVNLVGCLLIGFIAGCVDRSLLAKGFRVFVISGFLGGFTTFSSFSLETVRLIQGSSHKGMANVLLNLVCGFFLTFVGLMAAERM